jgi:hypothetical protein
MKVQTLLLSALLGAVGSLSIAQRSEVEVPFRTLLKSEMDGPTRGFETAVTTIPELRRVMATMPNLQIDLEGQVDWGREMVIIIALGQRRSGGYDLRIDSIRQLRSGNMRVHWTEIAPHPSSGVTQIITSPVLISVAARSSSRVTFVRNVINSGTNRPQPLPIVPGGTVVHLAGAQSGATRSGTEVISNEADWQRYWDRNQLGRYYPAPPPLNWEFYQLAAINLGPKPSTGFEVDIVAVTPTSRDGLEISWREANRGSFGNSGPASPFKVVVIPRVDGPVTFRKLQSR